jgi:hypothetical protein
MEEGEDSIDWFCLFIYVASFVALYAAITLEYKDLFCPSENQEAKVGNGASYQKGKPENKDDFYTLLAKIRISSRYDESSVYWRRSIIFSVLLTFTLLILILQKLPSAYEILASFTIIYLFTFLFLIYYQEVVSKPATKQVNNAINFLSNRAKF